MERRDVKNFPGYAVDTDGNVWASHGRHGWDKAAGRWRMLKQETQKNGYKRVTLCDANRKPKRFLVHRLILETFVGPCPDGMETRHKNRVRSDNRLDNIEWGTHIANEDDKRNHGTTSRGSDRHNAVMTEDTVREMRFLKRTENLSNAQLARLFKTTPGNVAFIVKGESWAWVT